MQLISLYIKTYKKDFNSFISLMDSIKKYNHDNIPLVVSVNDEDYDFFKRRIKGNFILIKDSDITKTNIADKWRYQQIIKMQFFKLNFSKNYVCIDSDSIFIRDFYISDFIQNETPFLIKHKSSNFVSELAEFGFDTDELFFIKSLKATKKIFNNKDSDIFDYGPSPYIWNCSIWESFFNEYLKDTNIESFFKELDKLYMPSENTIYGEYLIHLKNTNYIARNELFKVYHFKEQLNKEANKNIDFLSNKYKDDYLGIIIQSNFNFRNIFKIKYNNLKFLFFKYNY